MYGFHARTPLLCRSQAVLKRSAFRGALIPSRLDSRSFSARWVCERAEVGCDILSMSGATLTTRTFLRTDLQADPELPLKITSEGTSQAGSMYVGRHACHARGSRLTLGFLLSMSHMLMVS